MIKTVDESLNRSVEGEGPAGGRPRVLAVVSAIFAVSTGVTGPVLGLSPLRGLQRRQLPADR